MSETGNLKPLAVSQPGFGAAPIRQLDQENGHKTEAAFAGPFL
jgi:hypothetical protein